MTEKITLTARLTNTGTRYILRCPMLDDKVIYDNTCLKCEHCRIHTGGYVKCSYKDDIYKKERPFVFVIDGCYAKLF